MTTPQRKTGTREWSEHSVNCCLGCSNGCLYCYARANALRFGRIADGADWTNERPVVDTGTEKTYRGTVMFPTTHDIAAGTAEAWVFKLRALIEAKNRVLIVSKARPGMANLIRSAALSRKSPHASIAGWLERTELRVTLGTLSVDVARFWEPGAPTPAERLRAIEEVRDLGVTVSASMEPLLSPKFAGRIVEVLVEYGCNGEIWVGCANKLRQRTAWCKGLPDLEAEIARLEEWQTPDAMGEIYEALKGHPQVRWKDSYQKALGIDAMGRPER